MSPRLAVLAASLLLAGTAFAEMAVSPHAGARAPRQFDGDVPFDPPLPPPRVATAAPETAALATRLAGTWQCKGVLLAANGSSSPLVTTITTKLDLSGGWMQSAIVMGAQPIATEYRAFDDVAKQWTRVQLHANSTLAMATSTGEATGKWTWTGMEQSSAGTVAVRDFEELSKTGIKRWGEAMLGGSWQKRYELTCSK